MLVAVICSALGVVYVRHESRGHAVQLGQLENRKDEIIAEWSRLQLEQAMLADAGYIEHKAQESLGMREPEQPRILVVRP
jgi:cell division protein FtsL